MTTLYRPEIIKTVARADALPVGTFVRLSIMSDSWSRLLAPEDRAPYEADDVPLLALVPVEAEEEWALIYDGDESRIRMTDEAEAREWARIDGEGQAPSRRYTTIWEEA